MCKSVKGAAYFGSSVHIVAAFVFLVWFLFDTVITEVHINLWKCLPSGDDPPRKYNELVHYLNLPFKFLYYTCLCVTGVYIFRGVERNAPRVIKFALLVFVIVQVISLALFITISLNYWDDENHSNGERLPVAASRLVDPRSIPIQSSSSDPDQLYEVVGSDEDSGESYSINIEVFSHPPEVHHSGTLDIVTQRPRVQPVNFNSNNLNNGDEIGGGGGGDDVSKSSGSGPENLIIRTATNSTEVTTTTESPIGFDVITATTTGRDYSSSSSSNGDDGVVRIVHDDGREFLTYPSAPQSMLLEPESDPTSPTFGDEFTAVLEPPTLLPPITTPMPRPADPVEPDVVLVKVVRGGKVAERKLSHEQLVTLVFQVLLVGFNAVGSVLYVGVLIVHLTTL
ncbi:uncharacterized protein LOC110860534 [Folsomia candida]|uniref:Uncharacterized protein n=1 Tax=Folsomia candida TaxID=158441 RepID=A0A226D7F3_FOLCA|nr:uncharacterized protein LOC110860534 [Folsomia candida]OXA40561.1 hypothetical protein Fcan01_24621 [Folsomia candida]